MGTVNERILASVSARTTIDAASIRVKDRLCEDLGLDRVARLELISTIAAELQLDVELREANEIADVHGLFDLARLHLSDRSE